MGNFTEWEYAEEALKLLDERTDVPCVHFNLTDGEPDIFTSKIGGIPYLPHGCTPPRDKSGREMRLLCQVDCVQLAGLPDFPHEGMLQFWVSAMNGWDEADVTYHPTIDRTVTESEVLSKITPMTSEESESFFVVNGGYGMEFRTGSSSMGAADERCGSLLYQYLMELSGGTFVDEYGDDLGALFDDLPLCNGHRFGGYHWDPQTWFSGSYDENWKSDLGTDNEVLLLFQLRYDHRLGTNWRETAKVILGDAGVVHFFIRRKDLRALDFSSVSYHFSCS